MTATLSQLSPQEQKFRLKTAGLLFDVGPFSTDIRIDFENVRDEFCHIYADYPVRDRPAITDFYLKVFPKNLYRRWIKPQATIETLMNDDFIPLPGKLGMVSTEMGLNWQIAI